MKQIILSTLVLFMAFNSALAAITKTSDQTSKELFTASKSEYNDRMYLYIYCLANTEFQNNLGKAAEHCSPVLNKHNAYDSKGLEDRITADIKSLNTDIKDMISCLSKEAHSTSNLSDSSAVSFCEVMVDPTSGIEI